MDAANLITEIQIPEGVEVEIRKAKIIVSGPVGKVERSFPIRRIEIKKEGNTVKLTAKKDNALTKAVLGTFGSHITNMIKGVQEKFIYKLKACSIHFPMTVKVEGTELKISNFLGGKKPKVIKIPSEIEAKGRGRHRSVETDSGLFRGPLSL